METTSTCTSNDNPKKKIIVKRKVKGIVLPIRKELQTPTNHTHKQNPTHRNPKNAPTTLYYKQCSPVLVTNVCS